MKNARHSAQGLASLGRYGDTMLVHMNPQEVAGLQALARSTGGEITTNPHTGLPEAFNLSGFLPMIAGALASPFGPLAPYIAGAATGALVNRDNPLLGAVTGAFGGGGGGGLAKGAMQAAGPEAAQAAANTAASNIPSVNAAAQAFGTTPSVSTTGIPFAPEIQQTIQTAATTPTFAGIKAGLQNLGTAAGQEAFVQGAGGIGQLGMTAAGPLVTGMLEPPKPYKEEQFDPYATLNLSGDTGLRLLAGGGPVMETPDPGSNPVQNAADYRAYGLGGLSSYARGGFLNGDGDGMSDSIPATIEGKQPARLADGEFVVPADVVSHLGNGSTKAGAKRLYDMMARVRKARTGTTKQGKQINPKKHMPA